MAPAGNASQPHSRIHYTYPKLLTQRKTIKPCKGTPATMELVVDNWLAIFVREGLVSNTERTGKAV